MSLMDESSVNSVHLVRVWKSGKDIRRGESGEVGEGWKKKREMRAWDLEEHLQCV